MPRTWTVVSGNARLDQAQQFVALAEQASHQVVAGDVDLDLGGCHEEVSGEADSVLTGGRRATGGSQTGSTWVRPGSAWGSGPEVRRTLCGRGCPASRATPDDPGQDRLLDDALHELNRWVAETQVDDAIELRRRSAWLRRQADEESTMTGVLVDLAEHGRPVTLHLGNGRRHRGTIAAVGHDVVELRSSVGERVVVALDALDSVRPQTDAAPVPGDGPVPTGVDAGRARWRRLADAARAGADRRAATARRRAARSSAMGRDVLTVALDGGGLAYVSLAAVAEVSGPESG